MEQEKNIPFLKKITPYDKGGTPEAIKFVLGNGQEVVVYSREVSPENLEHAAIHGISQRLGDSCSAFSKDKDYASAFAALQGLKNQLATKDWNVAREGGAGRQATEDLIEALTKLKGQDEEVVRAAVEKASPETLKKWSGNTKVAAEIAVIKQKRATAAKKASNDSIDDIDLGV